jgi:hypothetical protein
MRTLIKVPLYVMIETEKVDQQAVMKSLYKVVEAHLKGKLFNDVLATKIRKDHFVSLIRTFTESSLAEAVLRNE